MTTAYTKASANTGVGERVTTTWNLAAGEAGDQVEFFDFPDRSVQVAGTFGGASLLIEGSNDGTNWATLADPQGNPLSFAAAKIEAVLECVRYLRPRVSGGDGTTALAVILFMRR